MKFKEATKVNLYTIEGLQGYWMKITATEAKDRPDAERAKPGARVCWFVPAKDEITDLTLVDDEVNDDEETTGEA